MAVRFVSCALRHALLVVRFTEWELCGSITCPCCARPPSPRKRAPVDGAGRCRRPVRAGTRCTGETGAPAVRRCGAVVVTGEAQPVVAQGAGVPGVRSVRALVAFRGRTRAERFLGARIGLDVGARRRLLRPRRKACPPARPQTRGECRILKFFGRVAPGNRTSCPRRSTGIRRRSGRRAAAPASARRTESGRTRSSSRCGRAVRRRGLPARPDRWRSWPWSMSEDGGPKFRNPAGF